MAEAPSTDMSSTENAVKAMIRRDEGYRRFPYRDTKGILTIGIGWNLEANGLPDDVIEQLFDIAYENARKEASALPGWDKCNEVRRGVLVSMVYQMGYPSVTRFRRMLHHIQQEDWAGAAREMLDSRWYKEDTPHRAMRLSQIMERGRF